MALLLRPCPHTQRSGISPRTGRFNMCVERSSATQGGPAFSEWACCGVGSRLRAWLQPRAVVYNRRAGWPWITEGSGRGTWRAWCSPVAPVGVKVCGCAVCGRRMVRAPRRFWPLPPPRHTPGGRLRRALAIYKEHIRLLHMETQKKGHAARTPRALASLDTKPNARFPPLPKDKFERWPELAATVRKSGSPKY